MYVLLVTLVTSGIKGFKVSGEVTTFRQLAANFRQEK